MLHGAFHLPAGDAAQLALAEAGGRVPQRDVREQQRGPRQDHESTVRPVRLSEPDVSLQPTAASVLLWI